jgi:hypothetical protein
MGLHHLLEEQRKSEGQVIWFLVPPEVQRQVVAESEDLYELASHVFIPEAMTHLDRNIHIRNLAVEELREQLPTEGHALLIGAGLMNDVVTDYLTESGINIEARFCRPYSWSPFDLDHHLQKLGKNFHIDVVENDPLVAAILRQQSELLISSILEEPTEDFLYGPNRERVLVDEIRRYNKMPLVSRQQYEEGQNRFFTPSEVQVIDISGIVRDKIAIVEQDIQTADLQQGQFDYIEYLGVSMYVRQTEEAQRRIFDGLKPGGFLIADEVFGEANLTEISRVEIKKDGGEKTQLVYQKTV